MGKLTPARRAKGQALHRPLLLLWAVRQAVHQQPRMQPWTKVRDALEPLLSAYGDAPSGGQAAVYPFWALRRNGLWEVQGDDDLALTSGGRRPKKSALDAADPMAGLPEDDYDLLTQDRETAAWMAGTLLLTFFNPPPEGLLDTLGLAELLDGRIDTSLRPRVGARYDHRGQIGEDYGGNTVLGITPLADGILTVYSDDKGPYADGRIPGTDWIAYTGDGLSGDQTMKSGNSSMAKYRTEQRALRYWHKPYRGKWSFETWAVITDCRRRWGEGQDGKLRREYVWVLAPVASPLRDTWPQDVRDALEEDDRTVHDDSADIVPAAIADKELTPSERYKKLTAAARRSSAGRTRRSKVAKARRYLRSAAAREAVLLRSGGSCESDRCQGHPDELTDAGDPILEVDHVNDLSRGGSDTPETMIALCPNCHAVKTRGSNRAELQQHLLKVARARHRDFS
ncbi:HNH endonuclease [Streptomyces albus]|uniref:HNH endonuclease n=1 Tax=Streptomyces albus TaxID=1888 RepID=UPI0037023424